MFTPLQRLNDKILPEPNSGCWLWTGAADRRGYGYARIGVKGPFKRIHRAVFELLVGPIPEGFDIDHTCYVPCCVNPTHLRALEPPVHQVLPKSPNKRKRKKLVSYDEKLRRNRESMRARKETETAVERDERRCHNAEYERMRRQKRNGNELEEFRRHDAERKRIAYRTRKGA